MLLAVECNAERQVACRLENLLWCVLCSSRPPLPDYNPNRTSLDELSQPVSLPAARRQARMAVAWQQQEWAVNTERLPVRELQDEEQVPTEIPVCLAVAAKLGPVPATSSAAS